MLSLRRSASWSALRGLLLAFLALTAAHGAIAATLDEDIDDDSKTWKEIQPQLPPAPKKEDLIGFYVSPTSHFRFAIDTRSITVGTDGVIRYTLVGVSDQGSSNTSYEGIRCATGEKRLYAVGRTDGSWAPSRRRDWERISDASVNRQHAALYSDAFCIDGIELKTPDAIIKRLKARPTIFFDPDHPT